MSVWKSWSSEAFSLARDSEKPILVVLGSAGREFMASAKAEVEARFIPICVDPEVRPDVAIRVGADRAVVLSPEGARRAVLPLPAENLARTLSRLADESNADETGRPDDRAAAWTGAVHGQVPTSPPSEEDIAGAFSRLASNTSLSREELEVLAYADSERYESRLSEAFTRGLGAWIDTFYDNRLGRFRSEPPLSAEARAARALLAWDAFAALGEYRWKTVAQETTQLLKDELFDPSTGACRQRAGVDVYAAKGNALAALAALRACAHSTPGADDLAASCLSFLQSSLYDPLLGITHARGGEGAEVHGLLGDAAWTALAFSEAYLMSGEKSHREFADALLRFMFQELWERERGGFMDRIARRDDPAILREVHIDPKDNAVALEACWRLHHMKGVMNYRRWLDWGLSSAWAASAGHPLAAARLARVADMARRGRADFELVGRVGDVKGRELLKALRRLRVPRAIVSFVDPDDQDYILAHKLTAQAYPRLFGCGADLRRLADADEPGRVAEVVDAVRSSEGL